MLMLCLRALECGGSRKTATNFHWPMAGDCSSPFTTVYRSVPSDPSRFYDFVPGAVHTLHLEIETRCRECERCLKWRRLRWFYRARKEIVAAPRTWFATLTAHPDYQHLWLSQARHHLARQGVDYDGLCETDRWGELLRHANKEITLYVKRLRKAELQFRYLCVTEQHKSGNPHWHMLIHETDLSRPVRWAALAGKWRAGFSKYELVKHEKKGAGYVAKYLGKSLASRVRASEGYGKEPSTAIAGGILSALHLNGSEWLQPERD